jgi:hypothetical protein
MDGLTRISNHYTVGEGTAREDERLRSWKRFVYLRASS